MASGAKLEVHAEHGVKRSLKQTKAYHHKPTHGLTKVILKIMVAAPTSGFLSNAQVMQSYYFVGDTVILQQGLPVMLFSRAIT